MNIQWFPGHMTKALRMLEVEIKLADAVFYVLDARAPFSSVNPKLNEIAGNKPFIYILNKEDLANDEITAKWKKYFSQKNNIALSLNSMKSNTSTVLTKEAIKLLSVKLEKYKAKGINKPIRAMVVGVPNSGKSSLINNLCGKAKTVTGNKPGVTRGKQWVRINKMLEVLDTPGTLWPSFDNEEVAKNLAFIGSIKDEVLNIYELATEFVKKLKKIDINVLKQRYKIETIAEKNEDVLLQIAENRGFKLTGNELDTERASITLLDDFRKGRLGKITLETPNVR